MTMRPPARDLPLMFVDVSITAGAVTILDHITLTLAPGQPTLPEPFGPISIVGRPGASVSVT